MPVVPGLCAALVRSRLGFLFALHLWAAGVGGQTGLSVCCVLLVSVFFLVLAWEECLRPNAPLFSERCVLLFDVPFSRYRGLVWFGKVGLEVFGPMSAYLL
jgi:hypothetical protein